MTAQQQTTNAPAGLTLVELRFAEDEPKTSISYLGPKCGRVQAYWKEGCGITVALDGRGDCRVEGVDLTPGQARALVRDRSFVLRDLDMLPVPEVERVAP